MRNVPLIERFFAITALILYGGGIMPLFRPVTEGVNPEGDTASQVVYVIIYFLSIYYTLSHLSVLRAAIFSNKGLLLLFCLAVASILWSDSAAITARRVFALLGTSLFGYYLAVRYTLADMLRLINESLLVAGVLSMVVSVIWPSHGLMTAMQEGGFHEGAWKGIYTHKNTLGRLMVVSALAAYTLFLITKEKRHWLTIALALFLIIMSRSSSALVLVVFVVGFSNLLRTFRLKGTGLAFTLLVLCLVVGYSGYALTSNYELLFEYLGKDPTLTGRTLLWDHVLTAIQKRPYFGHGFGGFWVGGQGSASTIISQELNWDIPNAHNGFLDLLLDLGYVGLVFFLLFYFGSLLSYMKQYSLHRQVAYNWGVTYMLLFLVYNLVESNALRQNSFLWVVFVATLTSYSLYASLQKRLIFGASSRHQVSVNVSTPLPAMEL